MTNSHYPVLLNESIELLNIVPNGIYVDGTFGRGGHSRKILDKLDSNGRLIAFDKDLDAINYGQNEFKDSRITFIHSSFANIQSELAKLGINSVNGVILDLGVSSPQLDNKMRGFSFRDDGPLDMRMDVTRGLTASQWLLQVTENDLADVLLNYGEERFAKRIARAIIERRAVTNINTTNQLSEIISSAIPFKEKGKHKATRSFQAIRIFINAELKDLEKFLQVVPDMLLDGSTLVVISFHSLEDRIVKNSFNQWSSGELLPKWVTKNPEKSNFRITAKKVRSKVQELVENSRSRSAILRAIVKE